MDATLPRVRESTIQPLYTFWDYLTKPQSFVQESERRRVRWLSTLLLFFAFTSSLVIVAAGYVATSPQVIIIIFGMWTAYVLSRTRFYNFAAYLSIAVSNGITLLLLTRGDGTSLNNFSVLVVFTILATLLLPLRGAIVVMVFNTLYVALVPTFAPQHTVTLSLIILITTSVLLIVFSIYRDLVEQDRQAVLAESLKRTQEANQTLTKANALAREMVRVKSEFMSTMSHELRTPLNAITGFCGIMLEGMGGEIDEDATHMLERIQSNSERLLGLINQVLDLAKIEADRIDLMWVAFSPRELANRWKSQVQVLAEKKGLSFEVTVDPTLPETIFGDPDRISQIAINLLSNAFKFTEQGGVQLYIRSADDTWQIEVQDTGTGIPPHALNYIFDEFRQLDGSSTRVYGGSGLGLAIVRKLCLLMNGTVRVTSTLGEGSIFTVTLPLIVRHEADMLTALEA
jgi:signal transduction histidine kinase